MLIEKLTEQYLKKASNTELRELRDRANQVYVGLTNKIKTERLLSTIITKYDKIIYEIKKRNLDIRWTGPLDKLRFKKSILGIDTLPMKPITIKEGFVSLSGTYAENYKTHNGPIDIVVKTNNASVIKDLEPKIADYIHIGTPVEYSEEEFTVTTNLDSFGTEIPVFDLVLTPVENPTRVEIEASKKKEYNPADIFVVPKVKTLNKNKREIIEFLEKDDKEGIVSGIVYRSVFDDASEEEVEEVLDSDYEYTGREDLEKAQIGYMINSQKILYQHKILDGTMPVYVIESFITDFDTKKNDAKGNPHDIPANSWWLSVKIDKSTEVGKELWGKILDGSITGFSLGGRAIAEEAD